MTIREATSDDLPAAQRLSAAAFAELRAIYTPTRAARARAATTAAQFTRLVAVDSASTVVGTVLFAEDGDRIHVRGLAVRRDARRRGVARALLERVSEVAAARSKRAISLYTAAEAGNVPVFEGVGFRVVWSGATADLELVGSGAASEVYMEQLLQR